MTVHELQARSEAHNVRLLGHTDLLGNGDGMHVNLKDGYAFVAHMGYSRVGTSIVDVSDPTQPRVVRQLETPVGTHSHKVQIVGDVLLVNYERNGREPEATSWQAGLKTFDISDPENPKELGFYEMRGIGVHRMTYWEPPYATMSGSDEGFSHQIFMILDLSDPAAPREVGRWWFPGMHTAGGEELADDGRELKCHHAIVRGDRAYCGWWDAGLVILDVADPTNPTLVSHLDFGNDVSKATHSAVPIPGRDILVVTDEALVDDCADIPKHVRVVSIADDRNPELLSLFPVPEGDFCSRGGRFGPHNIHEPRPGTLISSDTVFLTYFNAGLRVVDISDPYEPKEKGYFIPPAPPGRSSIQYNDIVVDANGLIYVTDRFAGGLYIHEWTPVRP